jgi:hypothetical protein
MKYIRYAADLVSGNPVSSKFWYPFKLAIWCILSYYFINTGKKKHFRNSSGCFEKVKMECLKIPKLIRWP